MIRPSALQFAERCGYASALSEKFPETGDAANRGTAIHAEIAAAIKSKAKATTDEAAAALAWIESEYSDLDGSAEFIAEVNTALVDGDSMEIVTEGTPDLVVKSSILVDVIDWKTGRPDYVSDVDDNLQLIAYGLAVCDGLAFRGCLVFLAGTNADARPSRVFEPSEHPALISRVKAAANREPSAHPGDHCGACWQRRYCHAWQAREGQALALIEQDRALTVTDDNAGQIMARAKAVKEAAETAESIVKTHVRNGGKCIIDGKELVIGTCNGRESADVKALKEAGLLEYIKQGAPYERSSWKKV